MLIPPRMVELNEPHVPLGQTSRQQAVRREGAGVLRLRSVQFKNALRLARQVHYVRHAGLHAIGHLVLGYPGIDFRISEIAELQMLHLGPTIQKAAAALSGNPIWVLKIKHRIFAGSK